MRVSFGFLSSERVKRVCPESPLTPRSLSLTSALSPRGEGKWRWLSLANLRSIAILTGIIFINGCSEKQRVTNAPTPRLINQKPVAMSRPAAVVPVSTMRIKGPRPQYEIDALYDSVPEPVIPRSSHVSAQPTPALRSQSIENMSVTAEPGWDVIVTREWRHIVIHHSASAIGSASIFDKVHREQNGWVGLGYDFVIGNGSASGDGEVEVGFRWQRQMEGAHAGNFEYNQHGIGICLVGDFQNSTGPTARQMESLRRLVRFLQVKTGIPTSEVVGHCNVPGKHTACPGDNLDLAAFRKSLGNGAIGQYVVTTPASASSTFRGPRIQSVRGGAAMP